MITRNVIVSMALLLALLLPLPAQAHPLVCKPIPHGTRCTKPGYIRTTCREGYRPFGTEHGYVCIWNGG